MIQSTYKYRFDRRTIYWSLFHLGVFVLLGVLLYVLYEGGYLSAWFTSFVGALIALMALSIPRKIVVTDSTLQVRCLLDITEIRRDEIASVRRVDTRRMKGCIPIFGGYGFFGYYGHFIDLRRLDHVRIYASKWGDFVEITDIYEERLYVSCDEADRLVAELTPPGGNRPDEEDEGPGEGEDKAEAEGENRAVAGGEDRAETEGENRAVAEGENRAVAGGENRAEAGGENRAEAGGEDKAVAGSKSGEESGNGEERNGGNGNGREGDGGEGDRGEGDGADGMDSVNKDSGPGLQKKSDKPQKKKR